MLSRCAAAAIASRSDTRAGAPHVVLGDLAQAAGLGPRDRRKRGGGIGDVEPGEDALDRRSQRLVVRDASPAARTSGANSSTIPRLVLAEVTRCVAATPSAISSPDASPQGRRSREHRAQRERRPEHVHVGRVGEIVGRGDVARLGRRHLQHARELHLMLESGPRSARSELGLRPPASQYEREVTAWPSHWRPGRP